jgi:hypothetical protein
MQLFMIGQGMMNGRRERGETTWPAQGTASKLHCPLTSRTVSQKIHSVSRVRLAVTSGLGCPISERPFRQCSRRNPLQLMLAMGKLRIGVISNLSNGVASDRIAHPITD